MSAHRPYYKKDIFYNFTTYEGEELRYWPRIFMEALDDAAQEMNYSNFHTDKFERIQEIIRRYCEEHKIPLGLSTKQRERIEKRKQIAYESALKKAGNDPVKVMKVLDKYLTNR